MNTTFVALTPNSVDEQIIRGVSVITAGPARGHGLMVDETTLEQVIRCSKSRAVKVKMQHNTDLSQVVGTLKDFRRDGDKVIADLHLLSSAPARDFVLEIAQTMPTAFGLSISFEGAPEGVFARCSKLLSVDLVDEPAANPDGLFEEKPIAAIELGVKTEPQAMPTDPEKPEQMQAPTADERLTALESAIAEIKGMLAGLAKEEQTEAPESTEMGKAEEQAGKAFESIEGKILANFESRFEALTTLIKSIGSPVAPGVAAEKSLPTTFTEMRKQPEVMRQHLIERGIFKH